MSRLARVASVALLLAAPAWADGLHAPTVWEKAKNPLAETFDAAHQSVEKLLVDAIRLRTHTPPAKEKLGIALHILEGVGAAEAPDVRLRFDLGRILSRLEEHARARPILERALRDAPDHPAATDAYFSLAICYAKLQRPKEEIEMYDEFLKRETEPEERAYALSNRGEASMLLWDPDSALKDYRASLAIYPENALAHWNVAVALDRTGDPAGSSAESKVALNYDAHDVLESQDVFFMPPYDIYWYKALKAVAYAEQIDDPATALLWWETAVGRWTEYIEAAGTDSHFLTLAKAHKSACERAVREARRAASRMTRAKPHR